MSDYDQLSIRILSGLTGELLPETSWHVPEGNEQRIAIAVCEATGMTPERWDRLSKDERIPWLRKTLKAVEKQPAPNAWIEGDDLPCHRPELAHGESVEIDTTPTLPQPPPTGKYVPKPLPTKAPTPPLPTGKFVPKPLPSKCYNCGILQKPRIPIMNNPVRKYGSPGLRSKIGSTMRLGRHR